MERMRTHLTSKYDRQDVINYIVATINEYSDRFWGAPLTPVGLPSNEFIKLIAEHVVCAQLNSYPGGMLSLNDLQDTVELLIKHHPSHPELPKTIEALVQGELLHRDYLQRVNLPDRRPETVLAAGEPPLQPGEIGLPTQPMPEQQAQPQFSSRPKEESKQSLFRLARSLQSVCCISSPGVNSHPLMLRILLAMGFALQSHRKLRVLIFDSSGAQYMGLEKRSDVVRMAYADPDVDPFVHFLDCVYVAYRTLRLRLAKRSCAARAGQQWVDNHESFLLVVPNWSYWALGWKRLSQSARKAVIRRWREDAATRLNPSVILPTHDDQVDPLMWMQAIAVSGPAENLRNLITVNVEDLAFSRTGLESDILANFTLVAAGQHTGDGPKFKACEWLSRRIGSDEVAAQMKAAKEWSKSSSEPIMLIDDAENPGFTSGASVLKAEIAKTTLPTKVNEVIKPLLEAAA